MAVKVVVDVYEAVGGRSKKEMGGDGYMKGPTDSGQYVVASCGRHASLKTYRYWSRVPWGTPLKEDKGSLRVFLRGKWQSLRIFTPAKKEEILDYHQALYGSRKIPKTWVFNDFGHMTCYFFKDLDKDRKLDPNEKIHPEYVHTTPFDEAQTAKGNPVILTESHGCIHIKPHDIDAMRKKGYFRPGNSFYIHKYSENALLLPRGRGKPPFEVHFFPGSKKIIIKGKL